MHDYMYRGEPLVVVGWLKMVLVWQVGFSRLLSFLLLIVG